MMEFEMQPYGVYVQTDEAGRITAINSDAFLPSLEGWVKIDEGYGDAYHHAQGNYLPGPLMDERGLYRYKLVNGKVIPRTQEEIDGDYVEPEVKPTPEERIAALEAQLAQEADRVKGLETQLASYETAYAEGVKDA